MNCKSNSGFFLFSWFHVFLFNCSDNLKSLCLWTE
jgi:hypothetical protein